MEQCTQESAMIAFTVMDHDVITANDFAGEAFLSLNNIPGVSESIDNFHGLKPIDLVLMQQRDKRKLNYCMLNNVEDCWCKMLKMKGRKEIN